MIVVGSVPVVTAAPVLAWTAVHPSAAAVVALTVAVLVGAVTNRVTGLGFSLVCSPAFVLALGASPGVRCLNVLSVVVSLTNVGSTWRHIRRRDLVLLLVPALCWTPVAAVLARRADPEVLLVAAGAVAVVSAVLLARGLRIRALRGPGGAAAAGIVSGTMNVVAGLSGPAVAMYGLNGAWPHDELRGTLQAYFLALNVVTVVSMGPAGPGAAASTILVAATGAGFVIGTHVARHVPVARLRTAVLTVVVAGGIAAIARGLL